MEELIIQTGLLSNRQRNDFRFEKGETAYIEYYYCDHGVVLSKTFVQEEYRNQGVGTKLVEKALKQLLKNRQMIVPKCPFVQHFIDENPQYHKLVAHWE